MKAGDVKICQQFSARQQYLQHINNEYSIVWYLARDIVSYNYKVLRITAFPLLKSSLKYLPVKEWSHELNKKYLLLLAVNLIQLQASHSIKKNNPPCTHDKNVIAWLGSIVEKSKPLKVIYICWWTSIFATFGWITQDKCCDTYKPDWSQIWKFIMPLFSHFSYKHKGQVSISFKIFFTMMQIQCCLFCNSIIGLQSSINCAHATKAYLFYYV